MASGILCGDSDRTGRRTGESYPRKLIQHLQKFWGWRTDVFDEGIYYIQGFKIPIQIIVTEQLSKEKNLWLRSLTDRIKDQNDMKRLLNEYREKKGNILYESVMQMIIRANKEKFKEVDCMCEALDEIIKMQFEEKLRDRLKEGYKSGYGVGMLLGVQHGMKEGMQQGMEQGIQQSTHNINSLILRLAELGRTDDIIKSASDAEYQEKLLREFGFVKE